MATLDQLSAALVKADAAGNADDARAFAAEIRKMRGEQPTAPAEPKSFSQNVRQGVGNLAAGAVRGAGSIGATILAPVDMAKDALAGKGLSLESNRERRAAMDGGLKELGADPDSLLYKTGKLAGEVAGTAGAGGVVAKGAQAVGAAPAIVTAIRTGGMANQGNAITRAAGGAVSGAASAGLVNPEETVSGGVVGAVLPPGVKVTGAVTGATGKFIRDQAQSGANRLMQAAIKPTIAQLRTGEAATAVDTLLQYGISPTKAGVNKLQALVDDLNNQIKTKISGSTATVDKRTVLDTLDDVRGQFTNQVSPTSDLNAIRGVADDFAAHPSISGNQIPVQKAQEFKQGTYQVLKKKYGQVGTAETEAQKGLARGLKEEIAVAVPGVQALNAEESKLLTTLGVAERRALMEMNKNPMGLAALAHDPFSWAAFMADRSASFKALAARMLNKVSSSSVSPQGVQPRLPNKLSQVLTEGAGRAAPVVATQD